MTLFRNLALLTLSLFLLTGCVHSLNKQGLTMSISEATLSHSLKSKFPIKKDFVLGKISINNPKVKLPSNTNRVQVGIDLLVSSLFIATQKGSFSISGVPQYKKENTSIYLKDIKIENIEYGSIRLSDSFTKPFLSVFEPMVNSVFEDQAIYKIEKDSFQGTFVKNIKIEDSELLVTYGL